MEEKDGQRLQKGNRVYLIEQMLEKIHEKKKWNVNFILYEMTSWLSDIIILYLFFR
jgi:hypothetical protein